MCQYESIGVSTFQYVSVSVSTYQYVSVRVSICQYMLGLLVIVLESAGVFETVVFTTY